jgi:catechol 2,3-dioxygenase-like lactoylglutathione lyase family enzyme
MLFYITLGTNDLPRAKRFYDAVMPALGYVLHAQDAREIGYGPPQAAGSAPDIPFWVNLPYNGQPASAGNGAMAAFTAPSRAAVDRFHRLGLQHGGRDEGAPGLRPYGPDFYACYLRDPDGNKLSAVCQTAP